MENKINLDLLCPECGTLIDKQTLACINNHSYGFDENVFVLLENSVKNYIDIFTARLHEIRKKEKFHHVAPAEYYKLPYTNNKEFKHEWRLRKYSFRTLNSLIKNRGLKTVLEIGPYNGWLSNRLAGSGFEVTSVDYFADELDGLKASRYYDNKWFTIQMDLRDLSIIKSKFDLVVVNHALQFFKNYNEIIKQAKEILERNGMLVILGLPFFANPNAKIAEIKNNSAYYKKHYNFQIELFPESFKGFLDGGDFKMLENTGLKLSKYKQLFFRNIRASLTPNKAVYYYGTYFNNQ